MANLVSRQKTLVEHMAANACLIVRGIDVEADRARLQGAHDLFLETHTALIEGDETHGLVKETNERVLTQLTAVGRAFAPFDMAALDISEGDATEAALSVMMMQTSALFRALDRLAGLVERVHIQSKVPADILKVLDFAGKQRWLSQKMVREACLTGGGMAWAHIRYDLDTTMTEFEARMVALRDGDRLHGVPMAQDKALIGALDQAQIYWDEMRPVLEAAALGKAPDDPGLTLLAKDMTPLLATLNQAVTIMESASY
ncbi:MAG: type IV pili methyl-accepting chemotaxis transducer N-terminal domain-containing protein [Pseudomonadota bacterium]